MACKRGHRPLRQAPSKALVLGMVLTVVVLFSARSAEARFLNLGGSLDLSYSEMKSEQADETTKTSSFQQRYNLHNYGELFSPRIGTVFLSATYLSQKTKTNGRADQGFKLNDHSINLNLLPYVSPLSLYYQRLNRTNKQDGSTGLNVKDRLTTLGGNWALALPALPRVSLSYNQSEVESADNANRFPNSITRFLSAQSSGNIGATTLRGRYQFNDRDVARASTGTVEKTSGSHAVNLNTESRLGSDLMFNTNLRWAQRGGGNAPGTTFAQERGAGASMFYNPSLKWGTHARVDFSETPAASTGGNKLKRWNGFWSGSFRPSEILDMTVSGRFLKFDTGSSETTSPFFDYTLNYRPFFGFSAGLGASYGKTEVDGLTSVDTEYQRYRGNMDYSRSLELVRYSASYGLSYGLSNTSDGAGTSGDSDDTMHTVTFGLENTQIRYIQTNLSYTFNDIVRSSTGAKVQDTGNQSSHRIQLNTNSSYFRALLREDDSLLLQSTASWTAIDGFGADGVSTTVDGRGNYYFFRGASLSAGYTRQDNPDGYYLDSDRYYEEFSWRFLIGATSFTLGARANQERTQGDESFDRDTIETTAAILYRIGKFRFSGDFRWSEDTQKGQTVDTDYASQLYFLRASRSF